MSLTALEETDIYTYKKIVKFLNEKNNWKKFPHHRACVASWEIKKYAKKKPSNKKISKPFFEKQEWNKKYRTLKKQKTKQLFCWPNDDSNLFDIYNTRFRKKNPRSIFFHDCSLLFHQGFWKNKLKTFPPHFLLINISHFLPLFLSIFC